MRKLKIFTGVLSGLFFAATVYGYLKGLSPRLVVILLLLHSLCLIALAYIFSTERNDYTGTDELQQELSVLRSQAESEKVTMQKALDAQEKELSEKKSRVEELEGKSKQDTDEIERLKKAVKAAEDEAAFAKTDINDFLPKTDEEPSMIDIIRACRNVIEELSGDAVRAGITIRISSTEESLFVMAQPSRLRILFRNIIDNSIKYMNRSGSLVITISTIDDDIFIVCKDTGEGLAEDETKHIFELNFQGSNRISGNGLGLTQAKAIVDSYGGTIYGQSTPGKGMGIYIQIPANRRSKEAV